MGQTRHLSDRFAVAEAPLALAAAGFQLVGFQVLGDGFQLFDQLAEGDRPPQRRRGHRPALKMTFWSTRQIEALVQPSLGVELGIDVLLHLNRRRQDAGFKHLGFQPHQH